MADLRSYGQVGYEAYAEDARWVSVRDEHLPAWEDSPPEVRTHWEASAEAVRQRVMNDLAGKGQ